MSLHLALLVCLLLLLGGCARGDGPSVSAARIGAPAGPNAAMYFVVDGNGQSDRLLGASTGVASSVLLHETTMDDHGIVGMRPVDGFDLDASDPLVLEPGGRHLMLVGVDRVEVGDEIAVTLKWDVAGEMTITAVVVDPAETMGHDG